MDGRIDGWTDGWMDRQVVEVAQLADFGPKI